MDLTMLKRFCKKQRLAACLKGSPDFQVLDSCGDSLAGILLHGNNLLETRATQLAHLSAKAKKSRSIRIPDSHYDAILLYLNDIGEFHQHHNDIEYVPGGLVLSSYATAAHRLVQHGCTFGTRHVHEGNSLVWARRLGFSGMGFIESIWEVEVAGNEQIFITLQDLDIVPAEQDPFHPWPGLKCRVAYNRPSEHHIVIEPEHLISHLAGRRRPAGTFGIQEAVLTLSNLNQGKVSL